MIGQSSPGALDRWLSLFVHLLELAAVLAGLMLVVILLARLLTSIWRVRVRGLIAILPFEGDDNAVAVGHVLPQRWIMIERELHDALAAVMSEYPSELDTHASLELDVYRVDSRQGVDPRSQAKNSEPSAHDPAVGSHMSPESTARLSAAPRLRPLDLPSESQFESLEADPIEKGLSPITFGGMSVSPDLLLNTLRRIEAGLARRTIRGTVHTFSESVRLSVALKEGRAPFPPVEVVAKVETGSQLLEAVDDLAFGIIKRRRHMTISMSHWRGYRNALDAYRHQLRFEWTASYAERQRAIARYKESLDTDPSDPVLNYNLGALLYARYVESDTRQAIEHYLKAAEADEPKWRALALAGLAMSYCQLIHRYGYPLVPSSGQAGEASRRAMELRPDLEEVAFAQGFALQVAGQFDDAIRAYERTLTLPGHTKPEIRFRSFALNNAGWIRMKNKGDHQGAREAFESALELWPKNKMSYANLGELCRRALDLDGAIRCYERAMQLDPEYINGANELGMIYLEMARGDAHHQRERLSAAISWHRRSLSLITGDSKRQEATVRASFADRALELGFPGLAEEAKQDDSGIQPGVPPSSGVDQAATER
jgi:tetratricopeptide (TPR) repeat protein